MHALAGTDVIAVPTALAQPWTFVANTIVPARAFESQLFVCYANWVGEADAVRFCGLSRVARPDGRIETAGEHEEELVLAEIGRDEIVTARAETPYLPGRRVDLYRDPATAPIV